MRWHPTGKIAEELAKHDLAHPHDIEDGEYEREFARLRSSHHHANEELHAFKDRVCYLIVWGHYQQELRRKKNKEMSELHGEVKKLKLHRNLHWGAWGVILFLLLFLFFSHKAHAQNTTVVRGAAKGSTTSVPVTATTIDGNHNAIDVNIAGGGGTGGGPADTAPSASASESDIARQKMSSVIRLWDQTLTAGSQLITARGDLTNGMWVNCKSGCSGSSFPDNSAFTVGTTSITNDGGVFNDGLSAVTSGNSAAFRITNNRALHINLRNASGTEIGTSSNPVQVSLANTASNATAVKVDGSAVTQPVSGTVTANIGTTNGIALDASVTGLQVSQASTTSGQKGPLVQGAVTTAAPSYTTAQTDPLSLDTSGNLRTSVNNTVTVSGTVTTTPPSNASTNVAQFGGTNVSTGTGAGGAGIPRVTISNDSSLAANQSVNVNQFGGSAVVTGTGASGAGIPRVTVSNDSSLTGTLADNGAAAATNRMGTLPCIAQTSYNNGTAATQGRDKALNCGTDGPLWVNALPAMRPASYAASATVSSVASATDIAVMPGNATNTVLLTKIRVSCTQTTAGVITLNIIKRTTADTAGTSSAMTVVPDDSNYAAGSSAPLTYTANPTVNSTVGNVDTVKVGCMATGTTSPNDIYILNRLQKPLVLRGTAQQIAVNLGGTTITGGSFTITFEWIETSTITP